MKPFSLALIAALAFACGKTNDDQAKNATAPAKTLPAATAAAPTAEGHATTPPQPTEPAPKRPTAFEIPAADMPYENGEMVWAAHPHNDEGTGWSYDMVRFEQARGDLAVVRALSDFVTHSAFVHAATPAEGLQPGMPVITHVGVGCKYGRVAKVTADKVLVEFYVSGPASGERELPLTSVQPLSAAAMQPGAPVTFERGDNAVVGTLAYTTDDKAYVLYDGIQELALGDVKRVDVAKVYKKGAKVYGYAKRGMDMYKLHPGTITQVHDGGVWYEFESDAKNLRAKLSYRYVLPR